MIVKHHIAIGTLMLGLFLAGNGASAANSEHCFADWSKAAELVRKNKIVDVAHLQRLARKAIGGDIITTRLCERGDQYIYRLVVRGSDGLIRQMTVDASRPFN